MANENPNIKILGEKLRAYECGFVLSKDDKGRALCAEINAWLRDMRERGELTACSGNGPKAPRASVPCRIIGRCRRPGGYRP